MKKYSTLQILIVLLRCAAVFFLCWRAYPFFMQAVPLGYDPGLYKLMIEEYTALSSRDRTLLPERIQRMYPPFLGMLTAVLSQMGASSDRFVTRGMYIVGLLPGLAVYNLIKAYTKEHIAALM